MNARIGLTSLLLAGGLAFVHVAYAKTATPERAAKPLGNATMKGLEWLTKHQNPDGGWGQGEESAQMGGGQAMAYQSNVADTCAACLALLRSGHSPKEGELAKGINFVCQQVEKADAESIWVTDVKGTRVQMKLGPTIDTFMASLLLAEVKAKALAGKQEKQVSQALAKVIHKIEKNQKADGTWSSEGWAPVLAQSMATKSLNRAAQAGYKVSEGTLAAAEKQAHQQMDAPASRGRADGGDAGVALYSKSAAATNIQDSLSTLEKDESKLREQAQKGSDAERKDASQKLKRLETGRVAAANAQKEMVNKMDDQAFMNGFGSNGGEEFLSYMNISESLLAKGGESWEKWDRKMTENLSKIQNPDGSWSGHHCITGRTFCTSAAVLVLTADRAPVPLALHKH